MELLTFTILFAVAHVFSYVIVVTVTYTLLYVDWHGGEDSLYGGFLRNMRDPAEKRRFFRLVVPTQVPRAVLMAVVLFPVLGALGDLGPWSQFLFLAGLTYIYTALASGAPFSHTIEGILYMKPHFVRRAFWPTQIEAVLYAAMMGGAGAWFLF